MVLSAVNGAENGSPEDAEGRSHYVMHLCCSVPSPPRGIQDACLMTSTHLFTASWDRSWQALRWGIGRCCCVWLHWRCYYLATSMTASSS